MTRELHTRRTILDIAARRARPGSGSQPDERLATVRPAVRRWCPADLEDLESLISLGKSEYEGTP